MKQATSKEKNPENLQNRLSNKTLPNQNLIEMNFGSQTLFGIVCSVDMRGYKNGQALTKQVDYPNVRQGLIIPFNRSYKIITAENLTEYSEMTDWTDHGFAQNYTLLSSWRELGTEQWLTSQRYYQFITCEGFRETITCGDQKSFLQALTRGDINIGDLIAVNSKDYFYYDCYNEQVHNHNRFPLFGKFSAIPVLVPPPGMYVSYLADEHQITEWENLGYYLKEDNKEIWKKEVAQYNRVWAEMDYCLENDTVILPGETEDDLPIKLK